LIVETGSSIFTQMHRTTQAGPRCAGGRFCSVKESQVGLLATWIFKASSCCLAHHWEVGNPIKPLSVPTYSRHRPLLAWFSLSGKQNPRAPRKPESAGTPGVVPVEPKAKNTTSWPRKPRGFKEIALMLFPFEADAAEPTFLRI